jgi:hypothetical protein
MEVQCLKLEVLAVAAVATILAVLVLVRRELLDKDLPVEMARQAALNLAAVVEERVLLELTLQRLKPVMVGLVVLRLLLDRRRFTLAVVVVVLIQITLQTEAQEEPGAAVLEA